MSLKIKYRRRQKLAFILIAIMLIDTVLPTTVQALTSGPSQPEVQSFEPVGTTEVVDLFSGDFTYNIPLFELPGPDGGYPFNLAYHSGIGMDQEASWTGLGWNINAGAINRSMRGIPDDFAGDEIIKTVDMKPSFTVGIGASFTPDTEIFGLEIPDFLDISFGVTPYYNNYRGFGYSASISPSLTYSGNHMTASLGVDIGSDMYEGKSYSPSLSLEKAKKDSDGNVLRTNSMEFSFNYSARDGVTQIGLEIGSSSNKDKNENKRAAEFGENLKSGKGFFDSYRAANNMYPAKFSSVGQSSTISLNGSSEYVPNIGNQMVGSNLNIGLKVGADWNGFKGDVYFSGFYNLQKIHRSAKNKPVGNSAYGYMHMDKANGLDDESFSSILDFNREADGTVSAQTKHLPVPVLTNDVYTISGQGVGARFTANKSNIGFVRDKSIQSSSKGGAIGIDLAPPGGFGMNGNFSYSMSKNNLFDFKEIAKKYSFKNNSKKNPYFETTYFKPHGDIILEDSLELNNLLNTLHEPSYFPVDYSTGPFGGQFLIDGYKGFKEDLRTKSGTIIKNAPTKLDNRRKRNANIQGINNEFLKDDDVVLGELEVKYFGINDINNYNGKQNLTKPVARNIRKRSNHIGGFITLGANGSRYVYGLPAYNLKHEEHAFSVAHPNKRDHLSSMEHNIVPTDGNNYNHQDHGNKYRDVTELPEYTHAHLLTSVLGTDYVDLNNDGPTDDDLGYWVKFNYVKTEDYQWRNPYAGANYVPGYLSDEDDDKGHFMYGERENYYMATAETKTHIAVFSISPRQDAKGWHKNGANAGASSYQLDEINIYTKNEYYNGDQLRNNPIPIKTVHLRYAHNDDNTETFDLCKNIDNHETAGGGKLTLTELWFTYRNNTRGENNKYLFDYGVDNLTDNPSYSDHDYDCWGNYRDNAKLPSPDHPGSYPYTPQYYNANQYDVDQEYIKTPNDEAALAWNLKKVTTPSGAIIEIEYEADDYAYIQNKKAMQMYEISANQRLNETNYNLPHCTNISIEDNSFLRDDVGDYVKVDIPTGLTIEDIPHLFDHTDQLFFKVLSPLINKRRSDGFSSAYSEFVTGYVDIDKKATLTPNNITKAVNENAIKIYLKPFKEGRQGERFHPITLAVIDFLQLERSNLIYLLEMPLPPTRELGDDEKEQKRDQLKALLSPIFNMLSFNQNFYSNANCKSGSNFIPNHSFVRLNNLNGFKEGGGIRVKKVVMKENENATDEYGQVYDYTIYDKDWGKTVSSGVATYEPSIGGEQNALKYGLKYDKEFKLRTSYKLFTEYPYNESYFPAASVGYSKVTVKSLNTSKVEKSAKNHAGNLNDSEYHQNNIAVPTTGTTVNEFYTSKDYPIYISSTELGKGIGNSMYPFHRHVPYPPFGDHVADHLIASQGYFIELNDMNGKQKSVHTYGHDQKGERLEEPYSSVDYIYHDYFDQVHGIDSAKRVYSSVTALLPNGKTSEMLMGLDYNFFFDVRSAFSRHISAGVDINTDLVGAVPIIFAVFNAIAPDVIDKKEMKYMVTNKIIWRTGILKETVVKHENSIVKTRNTHYDALTGSPLLTEVENNFDETIYNLTIPGYWKYEGMGPAYRNLGLMLDKEDKVTITKDVKEDNQIENKLYSVSFNDIAFAKVVTKELYPGDEFLVKLEGRDKYLKAYVMRVASDGFQIDFDYETPALAEGTSIKAEKMLLTRSGRRNQLSLQAGSVTSLVNPLIDYSLNCVEE